MKRTEMDRIERELRRKEKKASALASAGIKNGSVGDYINRLFGAFLYDQENIFNITTDETILEILEEIKDGIPEKKWNDVLRKAVKKTGISNKEKALEDLQLLMS